MEPGRVLRVVVALLSLVVPSDAFHTPKTPLPMTLARPPPEQPQLMRRRRSVAAALPENTILDVASGVAVAAAGVVIVVSGFKLIAGAHEAQSTKRPRRYEGEKGLGAFLRDGGGFANSAYRDDTLPPRRMTPPKWLDRITFPALDFVQVYTGTEAALEQAERLRAEVRAAADQGDAKRAEALERNLKKLMLDNGLKYEPTEESEAAPPPQQQQQQQQQQSE